jgi:hypothetical protein
MLPLRPFGLSLATAALAACTPGIGAGSGGGGAGGASPSASTGAGPGAGTTGVTTGSSTSSTGVGGAMPTSEMLYSRPFPAAGAWSKSTFAAAFPGSADVPQGTVISAVRLQNIPWMVWITSDQMAHVAVSDVFQPALPVDAVFSVGAGCLKNDQHLANGTCVNDSPEPPCVAVSQLAGPLVMGHVPGDGCGNMPTHEGVQLLDGTTDNEFDVAGPSGTVSFVLQRDYLTDCYPDPGISASAPVWAFQIARPSQCPGDWYDFYVFRQDQHLYFQNAGDLGTGVITNAWGAATGNPLYDAADPNQPDLTKVTAAYYDHATAKVFLFAP